MCEDCGDHGHGDSKPVMVVCGKGGVGKTVFSSLLSRVLIAEGLTPLLLVDADPVGGLTAAIGEKAVDTLAGIKDRFIGAARKGGKAGAKEAADQLDYFILKALVERKGYALLAMGHNAEKGCFCPANKLLKDALGKLMGSFAGVLIDAEAGIEQINRDVTGRVDRAIVVVDGSQRSLDTLAMIAGMVGSSRIAVVANRVPKNITLDLPKGIELLGSIPENDELRRFDCEGRPLWQLPEDNKALVAVRKMAKLLGADKSFAWRR